MKASPKPQKRLTSLFLRNMDRDVKDMFKGTASRRGEYMTTVVVKLMRLYCENPSIVDRV